MNWRRTQLASAPPVPAFAEVEALSVYLPAIEDPASEFHADRSSAAAETDKRETGFSPRDQKACGSSLRIGHPWGNAYLYQNPGKISPLGFDVISMGPDGRLGNGDDIVN